MATWRNRDLVVYHGTDDRAMASMASGLSLSACRVRTDFGQGFYTSTNLHQARQWANTRVKYTRRSRLTTRAVVIQYKIDRDVLAQLETLSFVRATSDFWAFVRDCRAGVKPHQRKGAVLFYDVIFGPVTLWPQELLIVDCDQISFHSQLALNVLKRGVVFKTKKVSGLF